MKELQNFVYKHMDSLKHHKRYLAMLTALSMLVTFIVPLILIEPADSMTGVLVCKKSVHTHNAECYDGNTLICDIEEHIHTNECYKNVSLLSLKGDSSSGTPHADNIPVPNAGGGYDEETGKYNEADGNKIDNVIYNPATLPLYTLLFGDGENHWVNHTKSLEENLEIVDDEYFLGFASDFCAFIENDFIAYDADAEGRMFVGGDLIFNGNSEVGEWNYQVGAGDYGQFTPIWDTDEYSGIKGFASGIIGGKVYRLGTMTTGSTDTVNKYPDKNLPLPDGRIIARHVSGYDIFLYPEEGAYKRFIVGNLKDSLHYDEDSVDSTAIDIPYRVSCNHLYYDQKCEICKELSDEAMASSQHSYLGDVNELSQFYQYTNVRTILERTFDTLRARSLSLGSVQAIEVSIENNKLTLDASNIGDAKTVYFKLDKWSSFNDVEIKVPKDRVKKIEKSEYTEDNETITELDLNIIITCDDENIDINIPDGTRGLLTYITFDDNGVDRSFQISKMGENNGTNNHPLSSNILYNFPYAKKVEFKDTMNSGGANFNGTIMAPNAHVKTENRCPGHLSGALIAKSFEGGLEFGYRPYRGGVDIFGMASGYAVPVNKVDENGKTLPGALFAVKEDGKFVSLFESGNGTNFAALPSRVDFTGNTPYKPEEVDPGSSERPYVGTEIPGEKLTAAVLFDLYKNYSNENCSNPITLVQNENNENIATLNNVLAKFYLDANQAVDFDANENFKSKLIDSDKHIYEIQLIKPVTSLNITARNPGESTAEKTVTVNFGAMTLGVDKTECQLNTNDDEINLSVGTLPTSNTNDTIYYKYFLNGNEISDYITNTTYNYKPTVPGGATFSVSAYVKIGEEYYEIAQATAEKVNVKPFEFSNTKLVVPDSITSGEQLEIKVENPPNDAKIQYIFNGKEQDNGYFGTYGIVGRDLSVKVIITVGEGENKQELTLQDTVTVDFGPDVKFNDYSTTYEVNPYSNFNFYLENIDKYLSNVDNDKKTITFYFKDNPIQSGTNNYATKDQKLVGENMPVYAIVTANGLERTFYGNSVTGKYNDNLSLNVASGAFIVGNNINMNISNAPDTAKVIFKAVDSNNNEIDLPDNPKTVSGGACSAVFTPETAGDYTIKATIIFGDNTPKDLVHSNTITVSPKPINGELSINPSEVNAGNEVELKISGAPAEADVIFTISGPNTNSNPTGKTDQNGEFKTTFTPNLAGTYTIKAIISKDGASKPLEKELTVKENTSILDGNLSISSGDKTNPETVDSGSTVTVNVTNATNGAFLKLTITGPTSEETKEITDVISDGTYSCEFTPVNVGTYTVTGTLTSGSQNRSLEVRKVIVMGDITIVAKNGTNGNGQFVKGESVTLGLNQENLPEGIVRVDYYLDSLDSNNVMQNKGELQPSYNAEDMTIAFTPGQTGIHKYRANAIDAGGNVIATVTQDFETIPPTYNFEISLDRDDGIYYGGETVTVTMSGVPGNKNNLQPYLSGFGGANLTPVTEWEKYTFVAPNYNYSTEARTLTFNIFLNDGSQVQATASITILDPTTKVVSYAFRRYLSILAEENLNDNKVEIDVPENYNRIGNLKIAFLGDIYEKQSTFKLQAEFKHLDGTTTTEYYDNNDVSGQNPYYLDIPEEHLENNVIGIVITPLEGSLTVDKCYPTYVKNENTVIKTSATGFTLNKNEIKEISVEEWVDALDSITFNLENESTASIWYALIKDGEEDKAPVFREVKVQNAKSISIPELNAADIVKIMVRTESDSLTVMDYKISGFVGDKTYTEEELVKLKNNEQHIINYYTLVEQQAPVGYFKEDTIYTIEVKETIRLDKVVNHCPKEVETTITVKDKVGNVVLSYTVETIDSENKRTIKISDDIEFTITKTTVDDNETLEVKCTKGGVDTSKWDTTIPKQYDNYYFDPVAMMVVPVPTPIKYTNKMGLLFRKVEKSGAIVKGVEINLVPDTGKNGESLWYWDENTSEWLIDYTNLEDKVYKFTETYGGSKYELADDIYFQKTGDKQITYWIGSETKPSNKTDENQLTVLNLSENFESRVIRMENIRVVGIKPKLKKTDMDGNIINDSAKFALYAADGTELLNPINVVNGEVDFNFDPNKVYDAKYVENGYLKPGAYYLQELNAPADYEAATKSFCFEIVKNDDGVYRIIPSNSDLGETIGEIAWSTDTKPDYTIEELTFYYADGTSKTNSKVVEVSDDQYWYKFDYEGAGIDPKNVVGIKLKVGGKDNGAKKFMIRNNKGDELWGEIKDNQYGDYTDVKPGIEYKFGDVPEDDSQIVIAEPIPTIDVDSRNTILISNKPLGNTMDLRVDKKWVGDTGITELRKSVEVQLMRKEVVGDNSTSYQAYDPIADAEDTPADGAEETPTTGKVILNAANNWTYVWEDLPRYVNNENADGGLYFYKIDEITSINGYTSSIDGEDINTGGTIIIKNTAETMNIPVEKTWGWDESKYNPTIPRTVKLKLQINVSEDPNESEDWKDVPGKTLVLTGDGNTGNGGIWSGEFTGLIKGYQYRVVEAEVQYGWVPDCGEEVTAPSENAESFNGKFRVTNTYLIPEGSLAIQKLWDEMGGTLPYSITVDLYRSVIAPSYTETDAPWTDGNATKPEEQKTDYKNDYARLLQQSLYFYDANMCGTDVAEKSALAWRTNCHTEDEILGGYHDAGDHVMFGLPQGYAATMLGWTYYEFIKGNTEVPSEEARHFKVILERFYDFFVKSVRYDNEGNISEILVQKGGGNIDHSYWGAPEKQVTRETEMFWSDYGADIAAEYAAALALGYLNFKDTDSEKYEEYLKVAKDLFEFAEKNPSAYNEWGVNKDETQKDSSIYPNPGFYSSEGCNDDMALAAGWLHLADPNGGYKDKFDGIKKNDFWGFSWNDVSLAAHAVGALIGSNGWDTVSKAINGKIDEGNPEKYFLQDGWGSARYNAIMQTAALVAAKHDEQNRETYKKWAQGQMNMLLGDNNWNDKINGVCDGGTVSNTNSPICLVTNFVPDGFTTDTPEAPHHRAASGWDSLEEYKVNCGYDDDSYALIGAMVGGPVSVDGNSPHTNQPQMVDYKHNHPSSAHSYIDDLHDYCCNEVSIDYNAGLVGAAAGLYYFYKSGDFSNKIEGVEYGAYGLDPYVETPIEFNNAQNDQQAINLADMDVDTVLKTFAMRQTAVRILNNAPNPIVLDADDSNPYKSLFDDITGSTGANVTSLLSGKNVTTIKVSMSNIQGYIALNDNVTLYNYGASADGVNIEANVLTAQAKHMDNTAFKDIWSSNYAYGDMINKIVINPNGATLNYVEIHYESLAPASGITLSDTEVNIGETVDITVTGEKTGDFTQSSTDGGEVDFNQTENTATAKKAGKVTIIATVDGEEKTAELTIKPMNLIAPEGNIVKGNSVKFSVSEPPVGATRVEYMNGSTKIGESYNQPNYELNYAFPESGEHTITAIAYYGDNKTTSAECTVNVLAEAPTPIEITNVPNPAELTEGDKYTFTSNKDNAQWTITENSSAASIDNSGNLTVKNVNSETQIKVKAYTSDSDFDEITIKILPINITYNGQSSLSLKLGDTTEYDLNVDRGTDLTWGSTNSAVVSVVDDKNGKIKVGNTAGPAQIIVAKNGETLATFNVTVDSESSGSGSTTGGSITFQNTVSQLYNGGSFTFTVNKTGDVKDVKWSVSGIDDVNNGKIKIDEDTGELTIAHDANSDNITVTATPYNSNGEALTAISQNVTIQNMQINNLNGDNGNIKIIKTGQTVYSVQLQNKPNGSIRWSVEKDNMLHIESPSSEQTNITALNTTGEVNLVATITDNNGQVIAVAKKTVKVERPTFSFKNEIGSMMMGGNAKLEINNTDNVSNITTKWSSSKPDVASVDDYGNVNAKSEGEAVIIATIYTKINNIDYEVGKLTQTINVTAKSPTISSDYKLITKYTYPSNGNTIGDGQSLTLNNNELKAILADHPVDAIVIEVYGNEGDNGRIHWDAYSEETGKEGNGGYKFTIGKNTNVVDGFFNFYLDTHNQPKEILEYFQIDRWWGNLTVTNVYFYAKELIPTIINAPSEMAVGDEFTLKAIALPGAASWTSSDSNIATIDPETGKITALNVGNVTFTANNSVSVTIPIKRKLEFIDENENPVEISKIRNNDSAKLSIYGDDVQYSIIEGDGIITIDSTTGIVTPIEGKTGTVKFKAVYGDGNDSNVVTLTVVDALKVIGENQQMPVGTKQQLSVENSIGNVEWSIKSGNTDIIEISENGVVKAKAYGQETVVVRDSDGTTVEFIIDVIVKPILPKDTENVKRIEFKANSVVIKDVVDSKLEPESGFETKSHNDWKVELKDLPLCDEKGNPYYYYIEETMYKKTSNSNIDETLDPKNANGYYVLSSDTKYVPIGYNSQGSVPTDGDIPILRVGNMATEKVEGQLPSTGGSGVKTYYYFGGALMLLGIAGFTGLKRRERKRRKE